jgi:hypothetical protein
MKVLELEALEIAFYMYFLDRESFRLKL